MIGPLAILLGLGKLIALSANAATGITNKEAAASGRKAAITRGAEFAVAELGKRTASWATKKSGFAAEQPLNGIFAKFA